ncbi:MAG: YibE/F family protein [Nitriliruptoraceae bacterium]
MLKLGTRTHKRLLAAVGVLLIATLVGIIALWPGRADVPRTEAPVGELVTAEVRSAQLVPGEPDPIMGTSGDFVVVSLRLLDGADAGDIVNLEVLADGYPEFSVGDRVHLAAIEMGDGVAEYYITDFERLPVLLILLGVFVVAVLIVSRWHGLRALLGLAISLAIVVMFVVPAILAGSNPPIVAWVGAMGVMIVTLYLTHGLNEMTTSAVVGTACALTATVGIGLLFISQGKITGYASDDAVFARFAVEGLDLQGLVLAGLIIAALGVLDDVTVSQASTVFALHDTDRRLTWRALFARAMRVGRDHIASVVNTLFLAYAGASLALLVLFSTSGVPVAEIVNSEVLAQEIIKTVVGSLGLITAVPFTTALAALVAVRRPASAPPLGGHSHMHRPLGTRRSPVAPGRPAIGDVSRKGGSSERSPADPGPRRTDDDEQAYRSWVNYLRENLPPAGEPVDETEQPHRDDDGDDGDDEAPR